MLKKIKQYVAKRKNLKKQTTELKKMEKYYNHLRCGLAFIQFVQSDLKNQANKMNRATRRRLQKTVLKGELTEELINYYKERIDHVLKNVEERLAKK